MTLFGKQKKISQLGKKAGKNSAVCWVRADRAAERLTTFLSAQSLWEVREACSHTEITAHHVCSRNTPGVWIAPLAAEDVHFYGLYRPLSGTAPRFEDMAYTESSFPGLFGAKRNEKAFFAVRWYLPVEFFSPLFICGREVLESQSGCDRVTE